MGTLKPGQDVGQVAAQLVSGSVSSRPGAGRGAGTPGLWQHLPPQRLPRSTQFLRLLLCVPNKSKEIKQILKEKETQRETG